MSRGAEHLTFQLDGQDEFKINLANEEKEYIRDFEKIVKTNSTRLVRQSKKNAPNFTGTLRNRIRSRDVSRRIGLSHRLARTVASRAPHRHLVGRGTMQRTTRRGANRGYMPANNYMDSAINAVQPLYISEMRARITKKVEI